MGGCLYCGESMQGKRNIAKFCSDICRLKAFRVRHGIPDPFGKTGENTALKQPLFDGQETKSFTCCENGKFYSPLGEWGKVLKCDTCGATWVSISKKP